MALLSDARLRGAGEGHAHTADNYLRMVDNFVHIFRASHPRYSAPSDLQFRLEVLQFATLFCRRLNRDYTTPATHQLQGMRSRNAQRSKLWMSRAKAEPNLRIPASRDARQSLRGDNASHHLPKLLDLLPGFVQLSAKAAAGEPSRLWLDLAADFMFQSALEQVLVADAAAAEHIEEALSWGFCDALGLDDSGGNCVHGIIEDLIMADDMFGDPETGGELPAWTELRLQKLTLIQEALEIGKIDSSYAIPDLEERVLEFVESLSHAVPLPILTQLESGRLHGLTRDETEALLIRVGLSDRATI